VSFLPKAAAASGEARPKHQLFTEQLSYVDRSPPRSLSLSLPLLLFLGKKESPEGRGLSGGPANSCGARGEGQRREEREGRKRRKCQVLVATRWFMIHVTVAILAQGTHWALHLCKPFSLWAGSPQRALAEARSGRAARAGLEPSKRTCDGRFNIVSLLGDSRLLSRQYGDCSS